MRLLYLADIRFPLERANGIQTIETCASLADRGHTVQLVVRPDTARPARDPFAFYGLPRVRGLSIVRAPVAGPAVARRVGYIAFAAGRTLGATRADLVFTRDLGVASLLLRIPAAFRPPLVYESHGYAPDVAAALPEMLATAPPPRAGKLRRLERRESHVWRAADGYVTITRALADALSARFGARPDLAVVADGVRADVVDAPVAARHTDRPVVGYAGHLYAWKGVDVLLEALARVPEADGLIVGGHDREPDLARVRDLAVRLGLDARVRFTGHVPPGDVPRHLQTMTVLTLPNPATTASTTFTSPLKLFEYMAAGRPIVASDLPALREVLRDGENAVLTTPGDPEALAAGLRHVLQDPGLAGRLARQARVDVADFTWARRAERLERLFDDVVAARR